MQTKFSITGLRKYSLALIAILGGIGLGAYLHWDANGYAFVCLTALGPHAAASVMQSKRLAGNRK